MKTVTNLLLVAIVLAGALLAGCQTKPGDVAGTAALIAKFSVPDGYQSEMAVDLAGYSIVSYNPGDGHSHLYLTQAPTSKDVNREKLEEMLSQSQIGRKDKTTRLTVVEQRAVTIRGQESTLVISEGTNGDGDAYRQATVAFEGKGGPALLVLEEPTSAWDDARLDKLIASIE